MNYSSSDVANRIKTIAKEENISILTMLADCGLSKNTLSSMQSGGSWPRLDTILKIADYLDISMDELLGRKKQTPTDFSVEAKKEIIQMLMSMTEKNRKEFLQAARSIFEQDQEDI